jgi:hypothetical protein
MNAFRPLRWFVPTTLFACAAAALGACSSRLDILPCAETRGGCGPSDDLSGAGGGAGMGGTAGMGAGMGGTAGTAAGMGGASGMGTGGAPVMGQGGAGMGGGGAGPCASDAACGAAKGEGSLCVGEVCTKEVATCAKAAVVVVAEGFAGQVDAALGGACFYRQLDPALAAVVAGTTTKVVAYAAAATVAAPLAVPEGVTLEGHTADAKAPVALTVATPVAGAPLVVLGAGSGLKGFALDGQSTAGGVKAEAGAVRLEGPLTIAHAIRAIDLGGTVDATVIGTQAAPVRLSANKQGVVVGATTRLALTGDGAMGGVTVEGTTAGAGVLVLAGGSSAAVRLEGLLARDNKVGTVTDGTGAIEVRQGRSVTVKNGVFEGNRQAITLNGEETSGPTSFANVVLEGNRFSLTAPGQGSALCGSQLGSQTGLSLGPGNVFPAATGACPPAQVDSCNMGGDVGHDGPNAFAITCTGG